MKPLSPHWADTSAIRMIKSRGDKESYVVASGITPSGQVHVGNFREVITVDLVARALRDLGKEVRFIYSWDNFDTFRKVPKNLPKPEDFEPYLQQAIARIPDPWQGASSYAQGRIELFESELDEVGIKPEFIYQESCYAKGRYAQDIRKALESTQVIKDILNQHRSVALSQDWLPTSIYCSACHTDQITQQKYLGEWAYAYECSCGHVETVDIRKSSNLKLSWRIDWPMRWNYEQVDFEPGGKDHSSQGGSFDTGKEIVKAVWGSEAPSYLQYDFVKIKGQDDKMSSSSGNLFTLAEVLEVYEPEMVRWIFASQRPNHDFSLAFDEDVIKIYDEFDRSEQQAYTPCPSKPGRWPVNRRIYELSLLDGKIGEIAPVRASFRSLCNHLQTCDNSAERAYDRFYKESIDSPSDIARFHIRAKKALKWLEKYASSDYKYSINKTPVVIKLNAKEEQAILALKELLEKLSLDSLSTKEINELLWAEVIHKCEIDSKHFFSVVYQKLISREQGPRLPGFLKELGSQRVLGLL